jgi:nicotinate-nucleotide--dimethylbenzimidazole phosphoribosyltransferase
MRAFLIDASGRAEVTDTAGPLTVGPDEFAAAVLYCGICSTDAKILREGHRDLTLPRILGHEAVVSDPADGKIYALWPGKSCGVCGFCLRGAENLCDSVRIIGFDRDGAFAEKVAVPRSSLFPLPDGLDPKLAALSEPAACVINALGQIPPEARASGGKMLIWGGGVTGLIAALSAAKMGFEPFVVERNPVKLEKCERAGHTGGFCVSSDPPSGMRFAAALNACSDADAFASSLSLMEKGGTVVFFSALRSSVDFPRKALNEAHYRQLKIHGAYGCVRSGIAGALELIQKNTEFFSALVEKVVPLNDIQACANEITGGSPLKIIVKVS